MIEISTYNANEIIEIDRTSTDINDIVVDDNISMYIPLILSGSGGETGFAFQS